MEKKTKKDTSFRKSKHRERISKQQLGLPSADFAGLAPHTGERLTGWESSMWFWKATPVSRTLGELTSCGLANMFTVTISFTSSEDRHPRREVPKALRVSLHLWTSFPKELEEVVSLLEGRALKGSLESPTGPAFVFIYKQQLCVFTYHHHQPGKI